MPRSRRSRALLVTACALALGCVGELDAGAAGPTPPRACDPGTTGAPVPMRRLTAEQVERTVRDVLGVPASEPLAVPDERLFHYRSNISSAIDVAMARGYLDFAEASAARADVSSCTSRDACLVWLLDEVGLRLFRRPLRDDERARYGALYDDASTHVGPSEGARWVLEAMIQSPSFLYLDEGTREDGLLDDHALASRLALTLWGAGPDRDLLEAAARGELGTADEVRAHAERMLDDPRSGDGLADFVDQWLELHRLDSTSARPDIAALGPDVLAALRSEPAAFFREAVVEGAGLRDLLTSSETPRIEALASIYGDDVIDEDGTTRSLDPARRAGILTLPGVQAALAHAESTSPTLRGYAVLAGFLCNPPGPPPAGVSVTLPPPMPGATTRERLELHFSNETCGACHRTMDGIGFAFERYDWLGRSRDREGDREIDDTGTFELGGREITVDGAIELAEQMADEASVAECIAEQWTQYATGIPTTSATACLVAGMSHDLRRQGGLREMILAQVTSDWFRRGGER